MKKQTKIIVAGMTGLIAVSGIAFAAQGYEGHRQMKRFFAPETVMQHIDQNGDQALSREELFGFGQTHFALADADKDQAVSKVEIINAIEVSKLPEKVKKRSGRIADRMVSQFDVNQDGKLTIAEFENRIGKFHALADWNDDDTVELAEIKRLRGGFGHRRHRGDRD